MAPPGRFHRTFAAAPQPPWLRHRLPRSEARRSTPGAMISGATTTTGSSWSLLRRARTSAQTTA
eukprot:168450-Chlamydomonas_euryale.AAC.1